MWIMSNFFSFLVVSSACSLAVTCTAACSMTCALFGSLWLDFAAAEGAAVSHLLSFLLRWRCTHCVWTIAARVHPPAGKNQKIRSREFVLLVWLYSVVSGESHLRNGASWHVQLHGLLESVRLVRVPNSRLLGRNFSLLLSRCSDLTAVTPVNAPSEN